MKRTHLATRLLRTAAVVSVVALATGLVYQGHGKALTAGLIDLVLVMLIAFRWGFPEAVIASVLAVGSLDFFYMVPIYSLYEHDPQDWISSVTFVTIALTAGHFAARIKQKAAQTESERTRLERLYLTSRDINTRDRRKQVSAKLDSLTADTFRG